MFFSYARYAFMHILKYLKYMGKKTILVTGSTGAIGLSISEYFYQKGYNVIINGKCKPSQLKSVKKKFKGLSDKAVGWLFIGPTVILLLAINIYPLIYAIRMSFTNFYANKIGREPEFIGLKISF